MFNSLYIRSLAEIAAIVWTLSGLDAFVDPTDNLPAWRKRLQAAATTAVHPGQTPPILAEARQV